MQYILKHSNITNISINILAKILPNCIIFINIPIQIVINILIYMKCFNITNIHKYTCQNIHQNILIKIMLNCYQYINIYIEIFQYYKHIHKYACQNIAELYHILIKILLNYIFNIPIKIFINILIYIEILQICP